MARWLLPVLLAACGGGGDHAPDAAIDAPPAPDIDGFDVVVSSTGVVVWVGFTGALANNGRFAAPGTCGGTSDVHASAPSCFAGLDLDNITLDSAFGEPTPNNPYLSTHATTATSMLSASDCGRRIQIALHAGPYAVATNVAGTRSGADVIVSWTTSAPYAIAALQTSTGDVDCNDAGASQHRFAGKNGTVALPASVQALAAPEITQTELGEVRVWYGDRTEITIP